MAIKTVLDTTDGLDEALIPLYVEKDGKFILDLEGVDDHPDVANLRNAYSRTKDDREKAKREATDLKARIAEIEKGNPDTAATQAKLSALEEKLAEAEARANDWQGKYTGVTRDQSLQGALQQVGITEPAFLKAASVMLSGQVKLGDDGTAYVETQMGPKVLGDYVKSWAAGEGAAFVSPAKGGGANGGGEGGKGKSTGSLTGSKEERKAALKQRFPDLE
jgi:DNA repair exonuclease SbcCD ATPase subunit